MIEIYTDGACLGNPGPGGWGAVIIEDGIKRTLSGADESTTNNRMEMLAVIQGLASVPESEPVTVFSDSQYVVNTMTRGWKRKANLDLWDRLDAEVAAHRVEWRWVRGHAGDPGNEEVDSGIHIEGALVPSSLMSSLSNHWPSSGLGTSASAPSLQTPSE